jgi:hypothetical protein
VTSPTVALDLPDAWASGAGVLHGGWLDEECEVWDSSGQLVVQARQLAGYKA